MSIEFGPLAVLLEPPPALVLLLLLLLLLLPQAPSASTVPASRHPVIALPRFRILLLTMLKQGSRIAPFAAA